MQDTKPKRKQAIALEYNPTEDAPKVIASGQGALAERIIEKAKESNKFFEEICEKCRDE